VSAPPVDGAANTELTRFLSDLFGVSRSRVTISAGAGSRSKRVLILGITEAAAAARILEAG
jgi:uncharacterized protein YggU (UPF0235/DUF167 family)